METRAFRVDQLSVKVYRTRKEMGEAAGKAVAARLRTLLATQPRVRMIFAAAPSQQELLDHLVRADGINWKSVTAFHMDEYIGLPEGAEQSFGLWLKEALFKRVRPGEVHYVDCGYNAVAMPTLESLKEQEQRASAAGKSPPQAAE